MTVLTDEVLSSRMLVPSNAVTASDNDAQLVSEVSSTFYDPKCCQQLLSHEDCNNKDDQPDSVFINTNGYWKQELLDDTKKEDVLEIAVDCTLDSSSSSLTSDSSNDFLEHKVQPFLSKFASSDDEITELGCHDGEQSDSVLNRHQRLDNYNQSSSFLRTVRGSLLLGKAALTAFARRRAEQAKRLGWNIKKNKENKLNSSGNEQSTQNIQTESWPVGELVWARPGRPLGLPWWPAIIVHRPRKSKLSMNINHRELTNDGTTAVPVFRVYLLGPAPSSNLVPVPQTRLRIFQGREDFDVFLRETVLQATDKIKALRQFVIPPSLQCGWQAARETAELVKQSRPEPVGRLTLFPWASEAKLNELNPVPKSNHARFLDFVARKRNTPSDSSDAENRSDQGSIRHPASSSASTASTELAKCKKTSDLVQDPEEQANTLKVLIKSFEFERLRFATPNTQRVFICYVCGLSGEQRVTQHSITGPHTTEAPGTKSGIYTDGTVPSVTSLPPPSELPIIVACIGGCGNYLHPSCARSVTLPIQTKLKTSLPSCSDNPSKDTCDQSASVETSTQSVSEQSDLFMGAISKTNNPVVHHSDDLQQQRSSSICSLCDSGMRQCFICNRSQLSNVPIFGQTTCHSDVSMTPHSTASAPPSSKSPGQLDEISSEISEGTQQSHQQDQMIRCSVKSCSRWYHSSCLRKPPFCTVVRDGRAGSFSCPSHTCLACAVENPGTLPRPSPRYVRCFLCPVAYHPGNWCFPSGSKELYSNWIICPRHVTESDAHSNLISSKLSISLSSSTTLSTMFRPTNVSWCFICSKGGRIICCESCPASFHEECLKIDEVPDKFICEDCTNGRSPRYGEIVWARLPPNMNACQRRSANYRSFLRQSPLMASSATDYASLTAGIYWWPAEIVHPRHLPVGCGLGLNTTTDNQTAQLATSSSVENHQLGLFPIRLFGLTKRNHRTVLPVYLWTTKARLFPYEEGDDKRRPDSSSDSDSDTDSPTEKGCAGRKRRVSCLDDGEDEDPLLQLGSSGETADSRQSPTSAKQNDSQPTGLKLRSNVSTNSPNLRSRNKCRKLLLPGKGRQQFAPALVRRRQAAYADAVKQAAEGWSGRRERFAQLLGRTRRPDYYKPIKVNWPLGSVRIYKLSDLSEAPRCECKRGSDDPCGPSSGCINRELHYECHPSTCPNGDACRNQRFTKRLYPRQRPFWTGDARGWGLKTLVPIRAGEFVNEYIGDLIDEEEANRRLRFAHENNVTNYYMMKLDTQRIIDAGPKGNLSRFMNHCCDPNLNTQKWTVNGDNRIGLFSVRDIVAGEELTFNYNFVALGQERLNCRCGATNCVGFLGARSESSASTASGVQHHHGQHTDNRTSESGIALKNGHFTIRSRRHTVIGTSQTSGTNNASSDAGLNSIKGLSSSSHSSIARGIPPPENVLIADTRHEQKCYRCGSFYPPVPNRQHDKTESDRHANNAGKATGPTKRGLERELEALVSDSANCSPVKTLVTRSAKRICPPDRTASDADASCTPSEKPSVCIPNTISEPCNPDSVLIHCSKLDCPKSYHLKCLDLDSPPVGRWLCPWHHCNACGRPSHIFCALCPASFCLAHVEGSVAVLPPLPKTNRGRPSIQKAMQLSSSKESVVNVLLARIVCISHTELIMGCMHAQSDEINSVCDKPVSAGGAIGLATPKDLKQALNGSKKNTSIPDRPDPPVTRRSMSRAPHTPHDSPNMCGLELASKAIVERRSKTATQVSSSSRTTTGKA